MKILTTTKISISESVVCVPRRVCLLNPTRSFDVAVVLFLGQNLVESGAS